MTATRPRSPRTHSETLDVGGLGVHVRVTGAGPPIVLVHGIGVSGRYLLPTARELAGRRTVYVPDLPGYGRSEAPRRALSIPELADALRAVVTELGLERPALLGNSLGCQILIELASGSARRTGPLVLVGPTLDPRRRTFARGAVALLRDWIREPELTPVALFDYVRFGPRRFAQTVRSLLGDRPEDKLPRVRVPVLVVRGERDGFITREWAEEAAGLAPHGRFAAVPGAAHAVNYTHPEALARLTLEFLDEVE